uniref:Protocadherin Fat 4 n=1 Tax=Clytia hemisphaerica TaxID=252671 RepID=A0A7M5VAC8_9CNID|eukprot:TCONS_00071934-protein
MKTDESMASKRGILLGLFLAHLSIILDAADNSTTGFIVENHQTVSLTPNRDVNLEFWKANKPGLSIRNFEYSYSTFIVPKTGVYFFDFNSIIKLTNWRGSMTVKIFLNDVEITQLRSNLYDNGYKTMQITSARYFDKNDVIEVRLNSDFSENVKDLITNNGFSVYFLANLDNVVGHTMIVNGDRALPNSLQPTTAGWTTGGLGNFYKHDLFTISKSEGIYLVTFSPTISNVLAGFGTSILINDKVVFKGKLSFDDKTILRQESMALSIILSLKNGDDLSFKVEAQNVGQILSSKTSRSIVRLGDSSTQGFMAVKTDKSTYASSAPADLMRGVASDWNVPGEGGFNNSVSYSQSTGEISLDAGVYKVAIQINVINPSIIPRWFSLQAVRVNSGERLSNLKATTRIDPQVEGTLGISSILQLEHFDSLKFEITSEDNGNDFTVEAGSLISLLRIGDYDGHILSDFPAYNRVQTGKQFVYTCQYNGLVEPDGYRWIRNQVEITDSIIFKKDSIKISSVPNSDYEDSYQCKVLIQGTEYPSNVAKLEFYDPYPSLTPDAQSTTSSVDKNADIGTVLQTFQAEAYKLSPKNQLAKIKLQIISGDPEDVFIFINVNESSYFNLVLNGTLNYDLTNQYILTIVAKNVDEPTFHPGTYQKTFLHQVKIENVNEHPPKFDLDLYSLSIGEQVPNGTYIGRFLARDLDSDPITYSMQCKSDEKFFHIDPRSGRLTTKAVFDYEERQTYNLFVQASDGFLYNVTEVVVNIIDLNDNNPVFQISRASVNVSEGALRYSSIYQIYATDADSGINGEISYSFTKGNDLKRFGINNKGMIYLINPLDYESVRVYQLHVIAEDRGSPSRSSELIIEVLVQDLNDLSPIFTQSVYNYVLSPTQAPSDTLFTVYAFDHDRRDRFLRYTIIGSLANKHFRISFGGSIQLIRTLPLTLQPEFQFLVQATDFGSPAPRSGFAEVIITSKGAINESHKFNFERCPRTLRIKENSLEFLEGDPQLLLTDSSNTNHTFSITNNDANFRVSPQGNIVIVNQLDYEIKQFQELEIKASNSKGFEARCFVNVFIEDVNDNSPRAVVIPAVARITTNFPTRSLVAYLRIQDEDSVNLAFTYSIVSGNDAGLFRIEDGSIFTTKCISDKAIGSYTLSISVYDGVFTTKQSLSVVIYKATNKNFDGHCGLDCNPITFSLTSTADGDVTFTNVEQNGRILNKTELLEIIQSPESVNYIDLEEGIATSLIEFFADKYNLVRLNITELSVVDNYRQKRSTVADPGFLTVKYVFEVRTTDATLKELNPIQKNETIEFTKSSKYRLQTNQELSVVSDVDECQTNSDQCDVNAYCVVFPNTISYTCQCKDNYEGDGFTCEEKVEQEKENVATIIGIGVAAVVLLVIIVVLAAVFYKSKVRYMQDLKKANANANAGIQMLSKGDCE